MLRTTFGRVLRRLDRGLASVAGSDGRSTETLRAAAARLSALAIRVEPQDAWAHYRHGTNLRRSGRSVAALAAFQRATTLDPDELAFAHRLEESVQRTGTAAEHLPVARALAADSPASWVAQRHLGHTLTALGDHDDASMAYRDAARVRLASQPGLPTPSADDPPLEPGLVVIGARRCGKTTLFRQLCRHPSITGALYEEIDFWSHQYDRGLEWYRSLFPPLPDTGEWLTGHTSARYLHHPDAAGRLIAALPDVRVVIMLRDPVDRAIADHHQSQRLGHEDRSFTEVIAAWTGPGRSSDPTGDEPRYVRNGRYVDGVRRWLDAVPPAQLLIVPSERLFSDVTTTGRDVCRFLGMEAVDGLGAGRGGRPPADVAADDDVRELLRQHYAPYNAELARLTGLTLPWS